MLSIVLDIVFVVTDIQLIGQPSIRQQIPLQSVLHQQKPRLVWIY